MLDATGSGAARVALTDSVTLPGTIGKNIYKKRLRRRLGMIVKVIDKENGKLVWQEEHETKEQALKAIAELKDRNFNPDYFNFVLSEHNA